MFFSPPHDEYGINMLGFLGPQNMCEEVIVLRPNRTTEPKRIYVLDVTRTYVSDVSFFASNR